MKIEEIEDLKLDSIRGDVVKYLFNLNGVKMKFVINPFAMVKNWSLEEIKKEIVDRENKSTPRVDKVD